jgi:hypothetical protein
VGAVVGAVVATAVCVEAVRVGGFGFFRFGLAFGAGGGGGGGAGSVVIAVAGGSVVTGSVVVTGAVVVAPVVVVPESPGAAAGARVLRPKPSAAITIPRQP